MVDEVLPRVPYRQWVLSMPKRVRWHLREKPEVVGGLLKVFLRAVETTIRQKSPGAPPKARFGAVVFVHRFGSFLNSHVHFHILVTDGVFSADGDGGAEFHPAVDLTEDDFTSVQTKMRHRGLRWLHRHGHLDSIAVHTLDAPDHAAGWSVNASVTIPAWDRGGLERLSKLVTPPRVHKHRYCGVLAPNAGLRRAVIESAGPSGATLKILQEARRQMGLEDPPDPDSHKPTGGVARSPPQGKLVFSRAVPADLWFEVDQTVDLLRDSWW